MRRLKRVRVAILLILMLGATAAPGQDLWEDPEGSTLWEGHWESSFLQKPQAWALSITGGYQRAEGRMDISSPATESQNAPPSRVSEEYYAIATMQLPLDAFWGRDEGVSSQRRLSSDDEGELSAQLAPSTEGEHLLPEADGGGAKVTEQKRAPEVLTLKPQGSKQRGEVLPESPSGQQREVNDEDLLLVVGEIVRRVQMVSGAAGARSRLDSLVRRSRYSGLAPELRLRGVYGFDQTTSRDESIGLYPGDSTTRGGRDSLAEVRLTFHLDRLLFGSQETSLERQRTQLAEKLNRQTEAAIDLFLQWRAAESRAKSADLLVEEQLVARMESEAALAQLHVVTDGWFKGQRTIRLLRLRAEKGRSQE